MRLKELYNKVRGEQQVLLDEQSMWDVIESKLEKPEKKRRFIWLWFTFGVLAISAYLGVIKDSESFMPETGIATKSNSNIIKSFSLKSQPEHAEFDSIIRDANNTNKLKYENSISPQLVNEPTTFKDNKSINKVDYVLPHNKLLGADLSQKSEENIENNFASTNSSTVQNPKNNANNIFYGLTLSSLPSLPFTKIINNELKLDPNSLLDSIPKFANALSVDNIQRGKMELEFSLDFLRPNSKIVERDLLLPTWGQLHDSSKSTSISYQFSTVLRYRHSSGIGLGMGIIARRLSEWYDATEVSITPLNIPSDSASFAVINGLKEYKKGILTGSKIERTNYHTPVRRFYLDIPFELSYNKSVNNFDIELFLAYNLNIIHHYYGRSYSIDQMLLDQNQLNSRTIYKRKLVNSTNFGLKINQHLTSNLSVGLSLNYWHQMSSSLSENSSIGEFYSSLGIGLNIKRSFVK